MTDFQIRIVFVIVFLTAVILGTIFIPPVSGELDENAKKAIEDINKLIEKLDKLEGKNSTKDKYFEHEKHPPLKKVCGFMQFSVPGKYFTSDKLWCYVV